MAPVTHRAHLRGEDVEILYAELQYPRSPDREKAVEVSLCDVRAADSLLLEYDFDRDGWVIMQASKFEWDGGDPVCDPDWKEVAFVASWAREEKEVS